MRSRKIIDIACLAGMDVKEYAEEIMAIANMSGLDVANNVNHKAFYQRLVSYEHFRAAAELLTTIVLSR